MANWTWEGLNKDGKREKGVINASGERDARKQLRSRGVRIKRLNPPSILEFDISEWMVKKGFAKAFSAKELAHFTKQLHIMINAGVPILQALEIIYKAERNISLKHSVKQVSIDVGEGKTIAEAMEKQKGFGRLYCNLIKAGEAGGILDAILHKLSIHLEKQETIKKQIKSAATYPVIVCIIGAVVIWGMMVFVVPQFVGMLADTGQEIPAITQFVIDASEMFQEYSLIGVPSLIVLAVILKNFVTTPTGKAIYDKVMMKMPIFGPIVVKGNLSAFCRTLATLLSSGVALIDSLDICIETLDNRVIAKDLKHARMQIEQGKTLTEPLVKIDYFPDMISQMIRVGEQTGQMDQMLDKVADVFEDEVNNLVEGMTKMIEPIIIVVLGGMIAGILVAMYLPMFSSAGAA